MSLLTGDTGLWVQRDGPHLRGTTPQVEMEKADGSEDDCVGEEEEGEGEGERERERERERF